VLKQIVPNSWINNICFFVMLRHYIGIIATNNNEHVKNGGLWDFKWKRSCSILKYC
jgi:hypothetical protein